MKLVKVTWNDTNETSDSGWVSLEEAKNNKPCKVASVGWLVNETEEHITIAADIDANEIESENELIFVVISFFCFKHTFHEKKYRISF